MISEGVPIAPLRRWSAQSVPTVVTALLKIWTDIKAIQPAHAGRFQNAVWAGTPVGGYHAPAPMETE